jgi:hypothetical protein
MDVVIQYFDGCPGWETARDSVTKATKALHLEAEVTLLKVETDDDAQRLGFRGSPSILVDGSDLFPNEASPIGMSCRVYMVNGKPQSAPSVEQLLEALRPLALG